MKEDEKVPYLETKYLSDAYRGIYTLTVFYTDGTQESREVPLGPILIPQEF